MADEKLVWQLTVNELVSILDKKIGNKTDTTIKIDTSKREYVYGIKGLANLLGCSKTHAQNLKSSGLFDDAIIQNGRKIIIDKEKALELFKNR